jgi:ribonuclease D
MPPTAAQAIEESARTEKIGDGKKCCLYNRQFGSEPASKGPRLYEAGSAPKAAGNLAFAPPKVHSPVQAARQRSGHPARHQMALGFPCPNFRCIASIMTVITDTEALARFCERQRDASFLAVDTEFMRERTYWPILCLVQVAGPDEAVAIDALSPGIDLEPLLDLMADQSTLKVFHAARQDVEIFFHLSGAVPTPLFDTQIAAMVCGFGDAASYERLVAKLARASLDKSSRFTDWSHRPLTERQISYALADVVHLRTVYERLQQQLASNGRAGWFAEEMAELSKPETYRNDPGEAWRRFRLRGRADPRFFAVLCELAAWRETAARQRNLPRGRIMRDEAVLEIAAHAPKTIEALARTRSLGKGVAEGKLGDAILEAVGRGLAKTRSIKPPNLPSAEAPPGLGPLIELLRVLLKQRCEDHQVAQKLLASAEDLEAIAADDHAPVKALSGWRREIFGKDAIALKHGRLGLTVRRSRVSLVELPREEDDRP